jgi:hypothetical protein
VPVAVRHGGFKERGAGDCRLRGRARHG